MLTGFLLVAAALVIVIGVTSLKRPNAPPLIQGILLPEALNIEPFSLIDHHNRPFTNQDLKGIWHLVSYGFTTCPDICPTTLSELAIVVNQLETRDLRILFYTVDHRRDTVSQLESYIPYFHPDFIGLTHLDDSDNPHLPFEKSLGLISQLVPVFESEGEAAYNQYQVNHGVTLYLINPKGQLQAILEPDNNMPGMYTFEGKTLLRDYLAIRSFLD
tara:strand:- start:322 stop:969 length:648 start_codon:yes stop_codon:yes gene_type:complete